MKCSTAIIVHRNKVCFARKKRTVKMMKFVLCSLVCVMVCVSVCLYFCQCVCLYLACSKMVVICTHHHLPSPSWKGHHLICDPFHLCVLIFMHVKKSCCNGFVVHYRKKWKLLIHIMLIVSFTVTRMWLRVRLGIMWYSFASCDTITPCVTCRGATGWL